MNWLLAIIDWIKGLGATVMLPIVIFIIGLILGSKPGRAFRSAVTIGIAFVGINLVIGLLWSNLGDAAQAMVARTGVTLDVVDVGWPAAAAIAFGGTVGTWIIPLSILVNIIMLVIRGTKTLNVDIWNFWHFAFTGSLVYAISQDLALATARPSMLPLPCSWLTGQPPACRTSTTFPLSPFPMVSRPLMCLSLFHLTSLLMPSPA